MELLWRSRRAEPDALSVRTSVHGCGGPLWHCRYRREGNAAARQLGIEIVFVLRLAARWAWIVENADAFASRFRDNSAFAERSLLNFTLDIP